MKFAHKLTVFMGGQCTLAVNLQQCMVICWSTEIKKK